MDDFNDEHSGFCCDDLHPGSTLVMEALIDGELDDELPADEFRKILECRESFQELLELLRLQRRIKCARNILLH